VHAVAQNYPLGNQIQAVTLLELQRKLALLGGAA
jgi:hypothetical protein